MPENQWYLKKEMKVRGWWQRKKKAIAGRKDYKIYKCPKCGQKLQVPRHKGRSQSGAENAVKNLSARPDRKISGRITEMENRNTEI